MKFRFLSAVFVLFPLLLTAQTQKATVSGTVVDSEGRKMAFVNVFFEDILEGDVTDSLGRFTIRTSRTGERLLIAMFIGYETLKKKVTLLPGQTIQLKLVMKPVVLETPGTTISASAFTSGDEKGVTLRSMDVVTTPGAAADIYLAIQTYPGVSKLDEGSGLFVRGGDVSETITILDQATVAHPYRWESPTGGVMGTISPFLVRGTFFSSGGFSAKYGNALSGILVMESMGMPSRSYATFTAGLAGVSAGLTRILIPGKLGMRFTGNYVHTKLMFHINGSQDEFSVLPYAEDANVGLIYRYSRSGQIKLFAFGSRDQVGVKVNQPSFDGLFDQSGTNQLYNLQWSDLVRKNWFMRTSFSLNRYRTDMALGLLDLLQQDDTYKIRTDHEVELTSRFHLNFGAEVEYTTNRFRGSVPRSKWVLDPHASSYQLNSRFGARRDGGYVEVIWRPGQSWAAAAGVRADRHNRARQTVVDPRVSLQKNISRHAVLRFSTGLFHQFPAPYFYAPGFGSAQLKAMAARHFILSYEWRRSRTLFRVEIYRKRYARLVLRDPVSGFSNRGSGYSQGLDLFFKHGELFQDPVSGWISYSFLQTRRLAVRRIASLVNGAVEERFEYLDATSPYDLTHNLTVVTKVNLTPQFNVGATLRIASGRPVTPIIGAVPDPQHPFYYPIEGIPYSERLPRYFRLDISATYYRSLKGNNYIVFFMGLSNLTNRKNVLDYDYSIDYSSRSPRTTNFSRFIYVGASMSIAL